MNYANKASRVTRVIGNSLTIISLITGGISTCIFVANRTDNTSTWVNLTIGLGTGLLTIFAAPAVVTGAAIVGGIWSVSQLIGGDEINGYIDCNVGYEGGILNQLGY